MNPTRRTVLTAASLAMVLSACAHTQPGEHAEHAAKVEHAHPSATAPAKGAQAAAVTQTAMALRDLWLGHIFWVRNVVTATIAGDNAAATAAENAVVANARQIADSIEPFYGKAASDQFFKLLAGHYGAVKAYLLADANQAKQDAALEKLTANANDIAVFLSGANPYLPVDTVRSLLLAHGGHHVQQIQQLRAQQFQEEAQTWEAMKNHMYVIADATADALARQFPEKFK